MPHKELQGYVDLSVSYEKLGIVSAAYTVYMWTVFPHGLKWRT